jgi:hypothetical protein
MNDELELEVIFNLLKKEQDHLIFTNFGVGNFIMKKPLKN